MSLELTLAGVIAIGTIAVGLYAIYRRGPGMTCDRRRCPETKQRAEIAVLREEGTFGTLVDRDVVACSLFPAGPVECSKSCLKA